MQTAHKKERLIDKIMDNEDLKNVIAKNFSNYLTAYKNYQDKQDAYNCAIAQLWASRNQPPFMNVKILNEHDRFKNADAKYTIINMLFLNSSEKQKLASEILKADQKFYLEEESKLNLARNKLASEKNKFKFEVEIFGVCTEESKLNTKRDNCVLAKNAFESVSNEIKEKLNVTIDVKKGGLSQGFTIKDNTTQDIVYIKTTTQVTKITSH